MAARDPFRSAPDWALADSGWRAALWVLSAPALASKEPTSYIDFDRGVMCLLEMERDARGWSHGEHLLVRAAGDLFNGCLSASLDELVEVLDDIHFRIVLQAIILRRG